jgi:hypothetical protein
MSGLEISIIAAAGLAGWFLVSWLFTLAKPKDKPGLAAPTPAPASVRGPTLADLGAQWHGILGVSEDSSIELIEARYDEALRECDRVRLSGLSSAGEVARAESRREALVAAYEFIRSARAARR